MSKSAINEDTIVTALLDMTDRNIKRAEAVADRIAELESLLEVAKCPHTGSQHISNCEWCEDRNAVLEQ